MASLKLILTFGTGELFGPLSADLLQTIRSEGSIGAASQAMRIPYNRASAMVAIINRAFPVPAIKSKKGGADYGGVVLTPFGEKLLEIYRAFEQEATEQTKHHLDYLEGQVRKSLNENHTT